VSLINDPKHWRDRAKEARAIADEMKDPDAKQMMLGIARDYVRLAESRSAGKGFATIKVAHYRRGGCV